MAKFEQRPPSDLHSNSWSDKDALNHFLSCIGLDYFSDAFAALGVDALCDLIEPDLVGDEDLKEAGLTEPDIETLRRSLEDYKLKLYGRKDEGACGPSSRQTYSENQAHTDASVGSFEEDFNYMGSSHSPESAKKRASPDDRLSFPVAAASEELSSSEYEVIQFMEGAGLGRFAVNLLRLGIQDLSYLCDADHVSAAVLAKAGLAGSDLIAFEQATSKLLLSLSHGADREAAQKEQKGSGVGSKDEDGVEGEEEEDDDGEEEEEEEYHRDMRLSRRLSVGDLGRQEAADLLAKALVELGIAGDDLDGAQRGQDMVVVAETPELREAGLAALQAAMDESSDGSAAWAPKALDLEVGLASRLCFLRWAKFDAHKARHRREQYWRTRAELFGEATTLESDLGDTDGGRTGAQELVGGTPRKRSRGRRTRRTRGKLLASVSGDPRLQVALRTGFCQVPLGCRDMHGRQLVVVKPGRLATTQELTAADLVRAVWFMLHAAFEEGEEVEEENHGGGGGGGSSSSSSSCDADARSGSAKSTCRSPRGDRGRARKLRQQHCSSAAAAVTQRLGVFVLADLEGFTRQQLRTEAVHLVGRTLQGALPVRVAAVHVIHHPWFFGLAWAAAAPALLKEKLRRRVHLFGGDPGELRMWLPGSSAPANVALESDFGWDHAAWFGALLHAEALTPQAEITR